jgi:hypothetical protein
MKAGEMISVVVVFNFKVTKAEVFLLYQLDTLVLRRTCSVSVQF